MLLRIMTVFFAALIVLNADAVGTDKKLLWNCARTILKVSGLQNLKYFQDNPNFLSALKSRHIPAALGIENYGDGGSSPMNKLIEGERFVAIINRNGDVTWSYRTPSDVEDEKTPDDIRFNSHHSLYANYHGFDDDFHVLKSAKPDIVAAVEGFVMGKKVYLINQSGHFLPGAETMPFAVESLKKMGIEDNGQLVVQALTKKDFNQISSDQRDAHTLAAEDVFYHQKIKSNSEMSKTYDQLKLLWARLAEKHLARGLTLDLTYAMHAFIRRPEYDGSVPFDLFIQKITKEPLSFIAYNFVQYPYFFKPSTAKDAKPEDRVPKTIEEVIADLEPYLFPK